MVINSSCRRGCEPCDLHDLWHMFPGLDMYSTYTDPAQHLIAAAI